MPKEDECGNLLIRRRPKEEIKIYTSDGTITVTVVEIKGNGSTLLSIQAPNCVDITRMQLFACIGKILCTFVIVIPETSSV